MRAQNRLANTVTVAGSVWIVEEQEQVGPFLQAGWSIDPPPSETGDHRCAMRQSGPELTRI